MKNAIQKAIKGGYIFGAMDAFRLKRDFYAYKDKILMDPKFWQALGKSLGWYAVTGSCYGQYNKTGVQHEKCIYCNKHRFIDWLDDGKSAEEFFNNLIQ